MEIIGKVSKGSKMDQIYLPKNRVGFGIGNYVVIKPLKAEETKDKKTPKLYFYDIKNIEPIKTYIVSKIIRVIEDYFDEYENIIITGSFLENGFSFNDIDILIISEHKTDLNLAKNEIEKKIGIKTHILNLNNKELALGLSTDPLYQMMLNKCISIKRLIYKTKPMKNYKILDLHLLKSKLLIDNFNDLTDEEKYNLIRNAISIYLFIRNKKISELNIEKEIIKKMGISPNQIKNNVIGKEFLKRYRNFHFKLEKEIIKNAAKQEKTN